MSTELAKELIDKGLNVCILGVAGTGKSTLVNSIVNDTTILVAPTGGAALNIGGETAHRVFGLPIGIPTIKDWTTTSKYMKKLFEDKSKINRIIIDEIGMVSAQMLDLIDAKLKRLRKSSYPFGGLQVIVVGDFGQIEPIIGKDEEKDYYSKYETPMAFGAKCWNFATVELTHVWRQNDRRQVNMLNAIHDGSEHAERALNIIHKESTPFRKGMDVPYICAYKYSAKKINDFEYSKLFTEKKSYSCEITGDDNWNDAPVDKILNLKVGLKIILAANDMDGQYVNGTRAVIESFTKDAIIAKTSNGDDVVISRFEWNKYEYDITHEGVAGKNVRSTFKQFPIRLGYAVTIHACQGMTMDDAVIDLGRGAFACGQAYTALSRVRDLKNLSFVNKITLDDIMVREDVKNFYKQLRLSQGVSQ